MAERVYGTPLVQSLSTTRSIGRFCSASRIAACHFPGRSSKLPASSSASWNILALKIAAL